MSWQREATTHSSSAPACSARVAVCRQWVSWSTANPSTTSANDSSMASTLSAERPWCCLVSAPITAHCSWVDTSMLVNEVVIPIVSRQFPARAPRSSTGQAFEDVGGDGGPVLGQHLVRRAGGARYRPLGAARGPAQEGQDRLEAPQQVAQL